MEYNYDIVVCGAGPAGAAASLFLSQQGQRHLLLDKSSFPRTKVCGDGITPVCLTLLEQVIPHIKNHFSQQTATVHPITRFRLYSPSGHCADMATASFVPPEKNNLYTISRYEFDKYLTDEAASRESCTFWDKTILKDYQMTENGVKLQLEKDGENITINTSIVIAADGDRSIFRKRLMGTAIERKNMVAAIRTYYKGVKKEGDNNHYEVFAYPEVLPGYFWIFPMADGTFNVGLGVTSDVIQEKKLNLRKLMAELIEKYPYLRERFKDAEMIQPIEGSGLPIMLEKKPKLSGDRILLTGDAASIADPISGEGIGPGIVTGKYAALVAIDAVKEKNFSAAYLARYDKVIHLKITNAYELRIKLFDWFIKHPWKINWLVRLAPKAGFIRNFFNNAANMRFSLQDLKNPPHWGRIFGAAKTKAGA